MEDNPALIELKSRIINHVSNIYPEQDSNILAVQLVQSMGLEQVSETPEQHVNHWDERDVAVITYGNTFLNDHEPPLDILYRFLKTYLDKTISIVHILPFFPFSSDDGFAVTEYKQVNDSYGDWDDIRHLSTEFKLMSDLVINHCSSRSRWFEQFIAGEEPGKDYFYCADEDDDISQVVRPRTSPLLKEVLTADGKRSVWCTFSHDQVDLNFANPDVLLEFVEILRFYLEQGIRIFRLDAVAFLWKESGSNCINLPQTHEIVRLLRTLVEHHTRDAIIITETNIPNRENLEYFGNANEAHLIYNFPLPPLILLTLLTGDNTHLKNWIMSMPPAMMGTTYFNFIASHDGIGLRPVEEILDDEQISELVATMENFGGQISWRALDDNDNKPYEINITLYDALKGTIADGPDQWQEQRFICAHTVMLSLEGIPAFYIHSLLATENDQEKFQNTNNKRAINRHSWHIDEFEKALTDETHHKRIMSSLKKLIEIRRQQAAFHPNATQFTLHLGEGICGFWRQSLNRKQSIFAISNITNQTQQIKLTDINLIATDEWFDLISNTGIEPEQTELELAPYDSVWLSNRAC